MRRLIEIEVKPGENIWHVCERLNATKGDSDNLGNIVWARFNDTLIVASLTDTAASLVSRYMETREVVQQGY